MLHKLVQEAGYLHTLGGAGGYLQIKLLLEPSHRIEPLLIFLEFLMDIIGGVLSAVGHQKASYQRLNFAAAVVQILKLSAILAVIGNGIDAKTVVFYDFVLVGDQPIPSGQFGYLFDRQHGVPKLTAIDIGKALVLSPQPKLTFGVLGTEVFVLFFIKGQDMLLQLFSLFPVTQPKYG